MPDQVSASLFERTVSILTRNEPLSEAIKSQVLAYAAMLTLAENDVASLTNNHLKSLLLAIGKQQETALKCSVAPSSTSATATRSHSVSYHTNSEIESLEHQGKPQPKTTLLLSQATTVRSRAAQKMIDGPEKKTHGKDHEKSPTSENKITSVTKTPSNGPNIPKELSSVRAARPSLVKRAPQGRLIKPTARDDAHDDLPTSGDDGPRTFNSVRLKSKQDPVGTQP